jgi:ATP-dependent Clp protease ATP-binding subunit ClpA
LDKVTITKQIHDELKRTYRAEFLGELMNLISLCPLDEKQPGQSILSVFLSSIQQETIQK